MMLEVRGMLVFHYIIKNCNKTCLNFTVKIMIFIKNTIFIFITVTSSDKNFLIYEKKVYIM